MVSLKDIKVILLHGNGGGTVDDPDHWFPTLKKELESLSIKVIAKTFPDNDLARAKFWLPFLEKDLQADANTILIGHSSGAVAAMRFAEDHKIFGSILVSPSYTDLGEEHEKVSGYFDKSWDFNAIKKNQNWIVQIYSIDDPFIPKSEAQHIHHMLDSEYYEFTHEGHFYPKLKFPEIVEILKRKLFLT